MYATITTKFLGQTNFRGSRVKASCKAGSIIVGWDHALDTDRNHIAAAKALAEKLGWNGEWIGGDLNPNSCVFVRSIREVSTTFTVV